MGFTEQQRAFQIEGMANKLNWTRAMTAAIANRFGYTGASEPNLTKAYAKTKDLNSQTAADLTTLLLRFTKMAAAFEPFTLRLDDPDHAKQLLEDFEAGRLAVSVRREEPSGSFIYPVFVIENLVERNKMFTGVQNSQPSWGTEGVPIGESLIANAAAKTLSDMGYPSHVLSIRMRTTETKIAKTLLDLGFILQEQEAAIGGTDETTEAAS